MPFAVIGKKCVTAVRNWKPQSAKRHIFRISSVSSVMTYVKHLKLNQISTNFHTHALRIAHRMPAMPFNTTNTFAAQSHSQFLFHNLRKIQCRRCACVWVWIAVSYGSSRHALYTITKSTVRTSKINVSLSIYNNKIHVSNFFVLLLREDWIGKYSLSCEFRYHLHRCVGARVDGVIRTPL